MIFVTLGSQKFQFNRLLVSLDNQIYQQGFDEEIFAQIGFSNYKPIHYSYKEFLSQDEYLYWIEKSDIVITHGGTGGIITSLKKGKKVIAVPRLARYGEHVDDHQLQLIKEFAEMRLIYWCHNCDELLDVVREIRNMNFEKYESHTKEFIKSIDSFIEKIRNTANSFPQKHNKSDSRRDFGK